MELNFKTPLLGEIKILSLTPVVQDHVESEPGKLPAHRTINLWNQRKGIGVLITPVERSQVCSAISGASQL